MMFEASQAKLPLTLFVNGALHLLILLFFLHFFLLLGTY